MLETHEFGLKLIRFYSLTIGIKGNVFKNCVDFAKLTFSFPEGESNLIQNSGHDEKYSI